MSPSFPLSTSITFEFEIRTPHDPTCPWNRKSPQAHSLRVRERMFTQAKNETQSVGTWPKEEKGCIWISLKEKKQSKSKQGFLGFLNLNPQARHGCDSQLWGVTNWIHKPGHWLNTKVHKLWPNVIEDACQSQVAASVQMGSKTTETDLVFSGMPTQLKALEGNENWSRLWVGVFWLVTW